MKWKAEDRGLVNAMELSWHRADMDRDLTRTMVKRQNPNKASLATSQTLLINAGWQQSDPKNRIATYSLIQLNRNWLTPARLAFRPYFLRRYSGNTGGTEAQP
jgi:hypothetical protein